MLRADNLSFSFQGKILIEGISLIFPQGFLYGIVGPNGSGKSTLLKLLSGIWTPVQGTVYWQDEDLLKKARKEISKIVTLVPQNPQVHFDFSVKEMVTMGRYPYGIINRQKQLQESLMAVDALHLADRSILHLSHGERKRIYIARALMTESPVLLLDEPESSLDVRHQLEIWHLLKKLALSGKTIIVTNHDLSATSRFCDEIAILNHGRCETTGPSDQVFTPNLLKEIFGVRVDPEAPAPLYRL